MAFNFPDAPSAGTVFTDTASGAQYVFTNGVWMQSSAAQIRLSAQPRNLLINGNFVISQEWGSTAITGAAYAADQWYFTYSGGPLGSAQLFYSTPLGRNGMAFQNTNVVGTVDPTAYLGMLQSLEGFRLSPLRWGTPTAIDAVLRFKFQATANGTYSVALRNAAADRCIAFDIPYVTTDGVKDYVFKIPKQTGGDWQVNNFTMGASLIFTHTVGSTYKAAASGVWQNSVVLAGPGITNNSAVAATNISLYEAGLYADPESTGAAPPFIPLIYTDDLQECQRYYRRVLLQMYAYAQNVIYVPIAGPPVRVLCSGAAEAGFSSVNLSQVVPTFGTNPNQDSGYLQLTGSVAGPVAFDGVVVFSARM